MSERRAGGSADRSGELYRGSEASLAAVLGGAVTRERLLKSARTEGRGGSPLIRSLLAQSLPAVHDLALAYGAAGTTLRLDSTFLRISPKATRLLPAELLRKERCVPVEILDDLCILAVCAGRAASAAGAVRDALQRVVLPVVANGDEIDALLAKLEPPPAAVPFGSLPRRDSPVHTRFRELVLEDALVDAVELPLPAGKDGDASSGEASSGEASLETSSETSSETLAEGPGKKFEPVRRQTESDRGEGAMPQRPKREPGRADGEEAR